MSEPANAKNKDCRCTANDVMSGTKRCEHGWVFEGAVTTADEMRQLVAQMRKLSRSPKLRELLDEMVEHVETIEADAQDWYERWQSECEDRAEEQKQYEAEEKAADAREQELDAALTCALADREALLERQRLTDREWSAMGGHSYADVEA